MTLYVAWDNHTTKLYEVGSAGSVLVRFLELTWTGLTQPGLEAVFFLILAKEGSGRFFLASPPSRPSWWRHQEDLLGGATKKEFLVAQIFRPG